MMMWVDCSYYSCVDKQVKVIFFVMILLNQYISIYRDYRIYRDQVTIVYFLVTWDLFYLTLTPYDVTPGGIN